MKIHQKNYAKLFLKLLFTFKITLLTRAFEYNLKVFLKLKIMLR